ncbi:MAG TPA: S24/S26 family peptidase [Thermoanaerobaculia bacterium]|nr:S24/S26 family peptidase [Thermoanaerobaculia bacterium]
MESPQGLSGAALAGIAGIWAAQKRDVVAAFDGTSMMPAIAPGQKVLLRCGAMPEIGDVAAYLRENQLAVHRVVARGQGGEWIMTWGDANPLPDDPVDDPSRLVGTIREVESDGTMRPLPPPRRSLRNRLILRLVLARHPDPPAMRRRVARLYRLRAIWRNLFC